MKVKKKKVGIKSKNIKHSFSASDLTSFGGLKLLSDFWDRAQIFKLFNFHFGGIKSNAQKFELSQVLLLLGCAAFAGVNRLEKITTLSFDPLVAQILSLKTAISRHTLTKQLKNMQERGARELEAILLKQNAKWLAESNMGHIIFDADSTVKTVYGNQEGASKGYNEHKKGAKSYHPLLMFIFESKQLYHNRFRPGNSHTANGIKDLISEAYESLPSNVKNVTFRADSGFFSTALIDHLEKIGWSYLIKVKFKGLKQLLVQQKYSSVAQGLEVANFEHPRKGSEEPFRFHAVRWVSDSYVIELTGEKRYTYQYACYITDLAFNPEESHDFYKQRSISETWIEQVKSHVKAGSTLTNNFWANDILWQMAVFAYNSSIWMRVNHKPTKAEEHQTFLEWMVKVPAKISKSSRQFKVLFPKKYLFREKWEEFDAYINYS